MRPPNMMLIRKQFKTFLMCFGGLSMWLICRRLHARSCASVPTYFHFKTHLVVAASWTEAYKTFQNRFVHVSWFFVVAFLVQRDEVYRLVAPISSCLNRLERRRHGDDDVGNEWTPRTKQVCTKFMFSSSLHWILCVIYVESTRFHSLWRSAHRKRQKSAQESRITHAMY